MANSISSNDDIIDVRDVIARFEELEGELNDAMTDNEEKHNFTDLQEYVNAAIADCSAAHQHKLHDEAEEYETLRKLLEELKGEGGDEDWRGDWYPITMIRDSYFEEAMDELLEDCGDLKPFEKRPSYIKIEIDYDALQMDYTSVEFEGVTYWYR